MPFARPAASPALLLLVAVALLFHTGAARADDDDRGHEPIPLDVRDVSPHEMWDAPEGSGPWLAVEGGTVLRDTGKREVSGMLLLGLPLDRWARRRSRAAATAPLLAQAAPRLKDPPRAGRRGEPPAPEPPPAPAPAPLSTPEAAPEPVPVVVRVTPSAARAAVAAALRQARLHDAEARIEGLASRARSSALLPELRLRATRLLDEAESLSPTEYDPGRTTATGGTSTWLEARATWRLDRLVFADEEVPLERLRHDRAEAEARVAARTLELLFAWQRALSLQADPARPPEEHVEATLRALECEASLDVVTGGWFSRWQGKANAPER